MIKRKHAMFAIVIFISCAMGIHFGMRIGAARAFYEFNRIQSELAFSSVPKTEPWDAEKMNRSKNQNLYAKGE